MIGSISSNHASAIESATSVKIKVPDAAVDLEKIEKIQDSTASLAKFDLEKLANMSVREAGCLKRTIFQAVNSISIANKHRTTNSIVNLCKAEFEKLGLDIRSEDIEYIARAIKNNRVSGSAKEDSSDEIMIRDKINEIISKFLSQKTSVESSPNASRTANIPKDIITAGMETEIKALSLVWEFPIILTDDFNAVLEMLDKTRDYKHDQQLSNISNRIYINNKSKDGKENIELLVVGAKKLYNKIKISGDSVRLHNNANEEMQYHKFNKEVVSNIRSFLEQPSLIDKSKVSRSIMESIELPIIDARVAYGEILGDIYFNPRNADCDSYNSHKIHIANVTVDHKTVKNNDKAWGRSSIPEVVSRAAKSLPALMVSDEGKIRDQSMKEIARAFKCRQGKLKSLLEVGAIFNLRNNWIIVDQLFMVIHEIHCIKKEGENIVQLKADKFVKEKQTIFQIQHASDDQLIINIYLMLEPNKNGFCEFKTSIEVEKCQNKDISVFARDIKKKEEQLNKLFSKTINNHMITDGAGKILPINLGVLVKELDKNWASDHPLMIWEGNTQSNELLMQRLEEKYIEGKSSMYTQMTFGARNKDFHYRVIIPKLKKELALQAQKFEDAKLKSPEIRAENMLERYAADGKCSDRLCKKIMSNKHFQEGFNERRVRSGAQPKDFNAGTVKCNDLKGAMNMLVHQFVSAQTRTINGKDYGYKNTSVFLMKSTLRKMVKENMRTEVSLGLENYFEKNPKQFVGVFVKYINSRLKEITDAGDTVVCFPLTATTAWNLRFYEGGFGSPSISEVLGYTFSKNDYRHGGNYRLDTDPTSVSNIAPEFSGKNDDAASNSMMRKGEDSHAKPYTKLGRRTIVELRWPNINSEFMPFWFSDEFLNRKA